MKALYFALARGPMYVNGRLCKRFLAPRDGLVRVHLGPGRNKYLDGWYNVDANIFAAQRRPEVWADCAIRCRSVTTRSTSSTRTT